jgi:pyrroline-5-carboxylate reductase
MENKTIAFIGGGNMTYCLVGGLIKSDFAPNKIWVSNPGQEKRDRLSLDFQINTTHSNIDAAKVADVIVLSVKPALIEVVCKELAETISGKNVLVMSVAACVDSHDIVTWLGGDIAVVRAMPNTPAFLSAGACVLCANFRVDEDQKSLAEHLFRAVGVVAWVKDDAEVNALTPVSGSGPAYFFYLMKAMCDAAYEMGVDQKEVRLLVVQTALGAARMALESNEPLETLLRQVTSPNGTTEKALEHMEFNHMQDIIKDALKASNAFAEKCAKELGSADHIKGRLK